MNRYTKPFSGMRFLFRFRRQTGPTPYCMHHARKMGVTGVKKELKFLKWSTRHNRAKALYWRMHKEQYPW